MNVHPNGSGVPAGIKYSMNIPRDILLFSEYLMNISWNIRYICEIFAKYLLNIHYI